jgi:hypothetical protein
MKQALVGLALMLFWAGYTGAQTTANSIGLPIDTQSSEIRSALIEPDPQTPGRELPDAPIPILPSKQDGPMPCPAGDGRPCALLGGRLYFKDRSHMTEHDKTWGDALKNPLILSGVAVDLGAAIWDYRATRACIDSHRCTEANPLMGQSRAQELAVGFGLTATFYFLAAKLKQHGNGNAAFGLLSAHAVGHAYQALRAQYAY